MGVVRARILRRGDFLFCLGGLGYLAGKPLIQAGEGGEEVIFGWCEGLTLFLLFWWGAACFLLGLAVGVLWMVKRYGVQR